MIDFTKEYKTKSGKRVIGLYNIPYNSAGEKVTYPIKGSIVLSEKPFRTKYQIWSEDGKVDVVFGKNSSEDLVLA
jgi:hypothetical protein